MHSPILFNDALLLGLAKLACQITPFAKMRRAPARFPPVLPSIQTQQPPPPPPTTTTPAQSFFAHLDCLPLFAFRFGWFIGLFASVATGQMWLTFLVFFNSWFCFLCRYCNYRAVFPAWVQIWRATARADYVRKYSNQLSQKKRPLVSLSGYDD